MDVMFVYCPASDELYRMDIGMRDKVEDYLRLYNKGRYDEAKAVYDQLDFSRLVEYRDTMVHDCEAFCILPE